ncbi:cysteine desulfurase family protein [Flintibacter muris]|uniref:cysteine desulfurase family protein n=1 Tax=Flintibacter muris TaxID=2941327 RepID=UPI0020402F13|nr:cysteine desulfurase family protein [Flintibacter muris]
MFHYLDNAATTPVRHEAAQAALEAMTEGWGNPSSQYAFGKKASDQVKLWRQDLAQALGCQAGEVFFTSCGSESDNWAICGALELNRRKGRHIVTTAIEHAAVLEPVKAMERQGFEVTCLQPNRQGEIDPAQLAAALRPDTVLVSIMLVNNELGTVLPVKEAARAIQRAGCPALLHCDAVQGFLKVPFTPRELGVDLLSVSGHKIHAPKGVGALYVREELVNSKRFPPLIRGGGQEGGYRSGTEATSQIAAFAAAARLGASSMKEDTSHMAELKAYAIERLNQVLPEAEVLTRGGAPHILPVSLPGYKSEVMVRFLSDRGICLSSGSACHRGRPSHVFAALKLPKPVLDGALRISFSYDTAREDVDALVEGLRAAKESLFTTLS